jgi:hypothetical protein
MRSPLSAVRGVWQRHGDLLGNAGSLVALICPELSGQINPHPGNPPEPDAAGKNERARQAHATTPAGDRVAGLVRRTPERLLPPAGTLAGHPARHITMKTGSSASKLTSSPMAGCCVDGTGAEGCQP